VGGALWIVGIEIEIVQRSAQKKCIRIVIAIKYEKIALNIRVEDKEATIP
jgi:hypothetical protein